MPYQVLARKYRPQRFADVAGQDHVTVTLMNALRQDRIAHGYIFSGHRGIGKTTIARILACALNCRNPIGSAQRPTPEPCEVCDSCREIRAGNSVDVIEIDAATNRGIDEIRELRDAARYRPSRDRFKIYILDEAHQITDAAFNALLKTLEEPPDHIVFMMATTQPEDIPQTVRSRCQHFSFHAVKLVDIMSELRGIAEHEGVDADESALSLLAEAGDGSMRDALSIMDQAIASAPTEDGRARLDAAQIRELMGSVPNAVFERILDAVDRNSSAEVITVANELLDAGNSPAQLARQAVRYLRSCVIAKITGLTPDGPGTELLQISPEEQRRAARTAALFTEEELTRFLQTMLRTFDDLGYRQEQRFHFELGLLKLVHLRRLLPVEEVLSSLSGAGPRPSSPTPRPTPARPAPTQATPPKPSLNPFAQEGKDPERTKRRYEGIESGYVQAEPLTTPAPVAIPAPIPVAQPEPTPPSVQLAEPSPIERSVELQQVVTTPEPVFAPYTPAAEPDAPTDTTDGPSDAPESRADSDAEMLQRAATEALTAAKQSSAADAISDATFTLDAPGFKDASEIRVQTELSRTMLPVVINADAEKIVKAALREAGAGALKLVFLPTAGTSAAKTAAKPRAARSGSAQAKAEGHPMVQEARRLFDAEIQTVIDLSSNE